ncbi:CsgG/HfaB family protein [Rubrivirga sp. IMCC45206]|uniref:CsgG/HfaB family protein n=1 Tax=Rubrivirga sp. IMCC45206 TaxID=3391614 RepID=UPI00398FD2ED
MSTTPPSRRSLCLALLAAVLAAGCGSIDSARSLVGGPQMSAADLPEAFDANLAVLAFENHTGDPRYDPLGRGLASMMTSDLAAVPTLRLVERERLQALVDELGLQQTDAFDPETALQVGRFIGADHVVVGSIVAIHPEIRLDTRVVEVETSEVVQTASVAGREDRLFDLQRDLAASLIDGIDVVMTAEARVALAERQQANRIDDVETALSFSNALALFDQGEFAQAATQLFEVQQRAPSSQLVSVALGLARDHGQRALTEEAGRQARTRIDGWLRGRLNNDDEDDGNR